MNDTAMCHIMVDLETLSRKNNACILSVGLALFSLRGKVEPLYHMGVHLDSCMNAGLHIEPDTVNWWLKQKQQNIDRLLKMPRKSLEDVIADIDACLPSLRDTRELYIWSHGSIFDVVILENAYAAVRKPIWWKYYNVRDTRTLFDVANYTYKAKGGHDALDDAMSQAEAVVEVYQQFYGS